MTAQGVTPGDKGLQGATTCDDVFQGSRSKTTTSAQDVGGAGRTVVPCEATLALLHQGKLDHGRLTLGAVRRRLVPRRTPHPWGDAWHVSGVVTGLPYLLSL